MLATDAPTNLTDPPLRMFILDGLEHPAIVGSGIDPIWQTPSPESQDRYVSLHCSQVPGQAQECVLSSQEQEDWCRHVSMRSSDMQLGVVFPQNEIGVGPVGIR